MTDDPRLRHQRLKEILFEASALPREQRAAFLESVCPGDPPMRSELESLLAHHDDLSGENRPDGDCEGQPSRRVNHPSDTE